MPTTRRMDLQYALLTSLLTVLMAMDISDTETNTKSHYTDAHRTLHRLVRDTTHSHLHDFEIAIPEIIHFADLGRRSRRSVSGSPSPAKLKLFAFGQHFHVELTPNNRLLAETFAVKRIKREISTGDLKEEEERSEGLDCHYKGRMLSHGNKTTAISNCDGLSGLLRTEEDDFILEPVAPTLSHDFPPTERPHVVYKMKDLQEGKNLHFCGRQKRHPMAVLSEGVGGIRQLSDGAMVIKTPEEIAHEYDRTSENFNSRRRRSTHGTLVKSNQRKLVVETLVVADRQFIKNHESDRVDVTTYILTVMNMVNGLFHDGTLDSQIEIVLVGITLLEDDTELTLDHRAGKSLASFCRWQSNVTTTTGRRPDHAILLTGIDICIDKNEPCDTLGLAQIGGMCSTSGSCTINEDMGLGLAFTVAHETGHSFGMKHDGIANSCNKRGGHIMSPTVNTLNGVFTWSSCSRRSLKEFLKSEYSRCLDDGPEVAVDTGLLSLEELPGQTYTAEEQCRLLLGGSASLCAFRYENNLGAICKHLWCQRGNGVCETKYMPAAEGTPCGEAQWCRRGVCVAQGSPGPDAIDGTWSKYGPWSDCTRSCGGGISFRLRLCNSPAPQYGGRYCEGDDKIYDLCNTQNCPADATDFRSQQCAEYDTKSYRRQYFSWVPYTKYWKYDFNKCELLCEADGYGFFDLLAPHVKDGTSCDDVTGDVCIEGKCTHVGCDRRLNSNATIDACGVCNGDNSTCRFVKGSYRDDVKDSGYFHVVRIPQGSRTIRIWEDKCCTHAFIAVKNAQSPTKYHLNGDWRVNLYGDMKFAGAKWKYEREIGKSEVLTSNGPLHDDIIVEALILRSNPGVSYSYATEEIDNRLPYYVEEEKAEERAPRHTYRWREKMSTCSKSCAGGEHKILVTCLEDNKYDVGDSYCDASTKPTEHLKQCNSDACPPRWEAEKWRKCSTTCERKSNTRKAFCKQLTSTGDKEVHSSLCFSLHKPSLKQECKQECPEWTTGNWSRCSRRCGRGVSTRPLSCRIGDEKVLDARCDNNTKPIFRKTCLVSRCRKRYRWLISPWAPCSTTCGQGHQRRTMKCNFKVRSGRYKHVRARKCKRARKPRISFKRPCLNKSCEKLEPISTPFAKATKTNTASLTTTTTTTTATQESTTATKEEKHKSEFTTQISTRQRSMRGETTPGIETKPSRRTTHAPHVPRWIASTWQQCTSSCGGGRQVRTVKCMLRGKPSTSCPYTKKPSHTRDCNTVNCSTNTRKKESECEDSFNWCYLVPHHNTCTHRYFGRHCCKSCTNAAKLQLRG